jgi:type IV pilus assembly protein PilW
LGTFLIAGVLQIFSSSKQSYRLQEGQSRVQENARYVLELLGSDIREAGYTGCRGLDKISIYRVGNPPLPSFDIKSAVIGRWWDQTASAWSVAVPAAVTNVAVGTDMITIQKGESCGAALATPFDPSLPDIVIDIPTSNSCRLSTANGGDATMVTDCSTAHILRVTDVDVPGIIKHENAANTANFLCTSYPNSYPTANAGACSSGTGKIYTSPPAQLLKFISYTYFIRLGTNGLNSLWRLNNTKAISASNPAELVEGVEDMQITYGIGSGGVASTYADASTFPTPPAVPAAGQNDWADVISARIDLLFESIDANLTIGNQVYTWNGATVTSSDGRIRRIFSTTITIRNRML